MKEEDKYLNHDEEEKVGMAAEPVGAAVRSDVSALGYNVDNWPGMPLVGPDNIEEYLRIVSVFEEFAGTRSANLFP